MKEIKDNFTTQSERYAKYRPGYPPELYDYLYSLVYQKDCAWDCATGNGQVAVELAKAFKKVHATDLSEKQVDNAVKKENIIYSIERAESSSFSDNSFDLITVAQAIHWFDFNAFYKEVWRTSRPGCIFAIIGYGLLKTGQPADQIIENFYRNIIGPYWDKERKYIDENFENIPFPFKELEAPALNITIDWTLQDLLGYIETWSAVQHYTKANKIDPIHSLGEALQKIWPGDLIKTIHFQILLKVARIDKS